MMQGIVSGASWFCTFLLVHVIWFHRVHVQDCFASIVRILAVCIGGHVGTLVALSWGLPIMNQILGVCYGLLVMGCSFILYMPFYYTIVTSLSVQTLVLLHASPSHGLSLSELQQRFASRRTVEERMKIMVRNGYLKEHNGKYTATLKGHLVSRFFCAVKQLWRLGPGG